MSNADFIQWSAWHGSQRIQASSYDDDDDDWRVDSFLDVDSAEIEYNPFWDDADSVNAECSDDDFDGRGLI